MVQGTLLLFLLNLEGEKDFFSIFPCFSMCSHSVLSKFLMGSQYVPQVHNAFLNMFTFVPYALANVVEDEGDFTVAEGHGHPLRSSGPSRTDDRARAGKNGRGADWL
jgi:hypothetical protein